jgi:hypothetical protein
MTEYVSEFGKRWDARVPRGDIHWYMGRVHVATSDEDVAADIRKRCTAPGFTETLIKASIRYALVCHKRNRQLYHYVAHPRGDAELRHNMDRWQRELKR